MTILIPLDKEKPIGEYSAILDGVDYIFQVQFNRLLKNYTFSIFYEEGTLAIGSQLLITGVDYFASYPSLFSGFLIYDDGVFIWSLDEK